MPRRRGVRVTYTQKKRISFEWVGFRSGGTQGNLDTSITHEIVPPAGAAAVIQPDITLYRVVGMISLTAQAAGATTTGIGMQLRVASVGGDQVIDETLNPLTTDVDLFDDKGIIWWQSYGRLGANVAAADLDIVGVHIPIDVKVKRKMDKRDTLVLRIDASTTGISRVSVETRCLIRTF